MKRIIVLLFSMMISIAGFSQTQDSITSSLIVALDVRPNFDIKENSFKSEDIGQLLSSLLRENQISPDFVSGVLYGIKKGSKTPSNFSRLIIKPIAFDSKSSKSFRFFLDSLHFQVPPRSTWGRYEQETEEYFSITSFAKPYSLMALRGKQNTNKTFMILITDGKYNGNDDYYGEAVYVKNDFSAEGVEQFNKDIKKVQTNYFCSFIGEKSFYRGYVQLYEFIPLQQYFALESVIDYPHKLVAKRAKKGGYDICDTICRLSNKNYEVLKIQASLMSNETIIYYEIMEPVDSIKAIKFSGVSRADLDNAFLELKTWVRLCDGVYDNTILHPDGSVLQGSAGLVRRVPIEREPDAMIFDHWPLSDYQFSHSFGRTDQYKAAKVWEWIFIAPFILLLVVVVVIISFRLFKKNNKYRITKDKIRL